MMVTLFHDRWVGYDDKYLEQNAFQFGNPFVGETKDGHPTLASRLLQFGGDELIEILSNININLEDRTRRAEVIGLEFRLTLIDEKVSELDTIIDDYIRQNKNIQPVNNLKQKYIDETNQIYDRLNELK